MLNSSCFSKIQLGLVRDQTKSDFLTAELTNPIYELSSFISFCLKHLDGRDGHRWVKTSDQPSTFRFECVCEQSEPGIGPHNVQRSHVPPPHSVCSAGSRRFNLRLSSSDTAEGGRGGTERGRNKINTHFQSSLKTEEPQYV